MAKILVVDDELGIRDLMYEILSDEGHTVFLAENAAQAREMKLTGAPDIVLLDVWMPDTDGVSLLKEWVGSGQMDAPVIMMSGHATIETAVQATKLGAAGFLEKPITLQKLLGAVIDGLKLPSQRSWLGSRGAPLGVDAAQRGQMSPPAHIRPRDNFGLPSHSLRYAMTPTVGAGGHLGSGLNPSMNPAAYPDAARYPETGLYPQQSTPSQPNLNTINMENPLREAREEFERIYFEYHLHRENGSMTKIAEKSGLERTHLYRKLKQLGLDATKAKRSNA